MCVREAVSAALTLADSHSHHVDYLILSKARLVKGIIYVLNVSRRDCSKSDLDRSVVVLVIHVLGNAYDSSLLELHGY